MKNWVEPRQAYAELNHPQSHVVDPKNASDLITDLKQERKRLCRGINRSQSVILV